MRAGRPAFIMDHSNRIVAACYRKFTTTTRAKNNVSRDLEHAIASDETRMREQTKPAMRSYLAVTRNLASGNATPRQFLERSLELLESWEPRVGAFVCTNLSAARAAADRASERWRAGRPLSPIDGMPVGIKDVIETFDMPTQMGSPLFLGWRSEKDAASVRALRDAGAVIIGKTVTTEFAASEPRGTRNPWNAAHTPGGSSSGSAAAVAVGIVGAALGTQVIGSVIRPASFCGCVGFKPSVNAINREGSHDYQSQSCTGILAASLPDAWQVAHEIVARVGGDAGTPGLQGPDTIPPAEKPRRLAVLETVGWDAASVGAKQRLGEFVMRLKSAGIEIRTRDNDDKVAALETDLVNAMELSHRCNGWETRWFIRTMRERDAEALSRSILDRAQRYQDMTLADHRADLRERARVRAVHAELAATCDACITLAAPNHAPEGLGSTGNPEFAVPASLLGVPALSLPLFEVNDMPLGLQVIGYFDRDADAFAIAGWLTSTLAQAR
jgi:Asp-tRNA(Asn)/Glu-tRNA(Gln) amidotransferase A subunit family amidase